jgi:hypothetical protein
MLSADYLRRQADNCLHIARSCFDLASVERMRHLAGELKAKADEIEKQDAVASHIFGRNDPFKDKNQRE